MISQAVVLVGGLGTRLGPLTANTPKPLLDVGGRPFIHWLLDEIARHDVPEVLLLAGFQAEQIAAAVSGRPGVRVVAEPEPRGTGGALAFARGRLAERFFFLNGDTLFDLNLWALAAAAKDRLATLALRPVRDASRYGAVRMTDTGAIHLFSARPDGGGPGVINGGVAVLDRAILEHIAPDRAVSIEADVYPGLAGAGALFGKTFEGPFIDIGVPDDFSRAQTFVPNLTRRGAVFFDRDGVINGEVQYAHRPDQIVWVDGAIEAIRAANDAGLYAFVVTNQGGVAHGFYTEDEVIALHRWMQAEFKQRGAHIDCFAYEPSHPAGKVAPYVRESHRRKPGPGMILELIEAYGVDRARSVMVGDRETDMAAAAAAGVPGVLFTGGNLAATLRPWLSSGR
jgi:D,D-heptose 1,7-bisphosphate phosphatase